MKKKTKKLLVMLLTVAMVFTYMAVPVYADEVTEAGTDEVITDTVDTTEAEAEPSVEEEQEVESEPEVQEEPAPEVVQEEAPAKAGETAEPVRGDDDEPTALDLVIAAIETLPYDPSEFTAADIERVEAINADFEALSVEDQEIIDNKTGHPNGDTQSYGRVLEASLWAVRSFNTDQSTTLADGTYTTSTEPAVSSVSNKGKSDSSRVRNWWVESVTVENGQATAYIYVTSGAATANKLTSYPSVWVGGETIERNSDNNYPIPVNLNGVTYFGGISSSMPRPIMYELTTTIDEPTAISGAEIEAIPAQTYSGKALTPDVTVKLGEETLIKDTDYTVSYKNNTNAGTATVTVTGKGNYGGTVTATFKINAKKITPKITLSKTILTYTGKAQKPSVTVYDGKTKLAAANYTATIQTGKNIGTYNVKVTLKGNYSGTKTVSYTIGPKGATIKAPKKAKKAFTAKWAAQKAKMPKARIAGYQVQYATDKAFTKNVKSVTVKGYKKTSRKISKLKSKTTYYVRVRTYIKVSGKTYYSTWSAIKSVKTK